MIGSEATVSLPSCVNVGIVAEGTGAVSAGDDRTELRPGSKFLIAAATENVRYDTTDGLTILCCTPGV